MFNYWFEIKNCYFNMYLKFGLILEGSIVRFFDFKWVGDKSVM